MVISPRTRRLALVAHVTSSVGWLGAVAAFLVLSVIGLRTSDMELLRACYFAMDLLGRYLIVPMSLLALLTGVTQSFITQWGLFRQYWVVAKLILTVGATALLLVHQYTAVAAASTLVLGQAAFSRVQLSQLGRQLTMDAALAIAVLMTATILSILKPWGAIRVGARSLAWYASIAVGLALVTVIVVHLAGGGMGRHGQ